MWQKGDLVRVEVPADLGDRFEGSKYRVAAEAHLRSLHGKVYRIEHNPSRNSCDLRGMSPSYAIPLDWLHYVKGIRVGDRVHHFGMHGSKTVSTVIGESSTRDTYELSDGRYLHKHCLVVAACDEPLKELAGVEVRFPNFEMFEAERDQAWDEWRKEKAEHEKTKEQLDGLRDQLCNVNKTDYTYSDALRKQHEKMLAERNAAQALVALEQEQVLRLKLELSTRPFPRPPESWLELTAIRLVVESRFIVWFLVDLLKAVPTFFARQIKRKDHMFLRDFDGEFSYLGLFNLVIAGVLIGLCLMVSLKAYFQQLDYQSSQEATVTWSAPSPSDPREQAWIEARARRER